MESPPEDLPEETIIIVGCVCGSIVLILLVVLIVLCCRRHQAKSEYYIFSVILMKLEQEYGTISVRYCPFINSINRDSSEEVECTDKMNKQ